MEEYTVIFSKEEMEKMASDPKYCLLYTSFGRLRCQAPFRRFPSARAVPECQRGQDVYKRQALFLL